MSNAAKFLLPKLQQRVANLPAVQNELKSVVTTLDEYINGMLMVCTNRLPLGLYLLLYFFFFLLTSFQEEAKQGQCLASAVSEVSRVLEETQVILRERIKTLYDLQGTSLIFISTVPCTYMLLFRTTSSSCKDYISNCCDQCIQKWECKGGES